MGMFDTILFKCPKCNSDEERQTKLGDCILKEYPITQVRVDIAIGLHKTNFTCSNCGYVMTFKYPKIVPKYVKMEIK